jgi:hypothetical protein
MRPESSWPIWVRGCLLHTFSLRHVGLNGRMLEVAVLSPLLAFGIPGFAPDEHFSSTQPFDWNCPMSFDKQSDVKNHLSHRSRSPIHLIEPMSQPDATSVSGVETQPAESPQDNKVEGTPKRENAGELEAIWNRAPNMSDVAQSATTQSVQD